MKPSTHFFTLLLILCSTLFHASISAEENRLPGVAAASTKTSPLPAGSSAPPVTLQSIAGESISLTELSNTPTALIFYRGGWCPYCNQHLSELQELQIDLQQLGFQIVGVSPDTPENLSQSVSKEQLSYRLLSDSNGSAARGFGIAFDARKEYYELYGDRILTMLQNASGETHYQLPVPSVFLIHQGKILFTYSNPDYKVRISPEELLSAARAVNNRD